MSAERGGNQITFEEVISNAKEIMRRNGNHVPTLVIEGSYKLVVSQIQDMPATHGERVELLRFLGQIAAKSGSVRQLQQVFMVTEGWMSTANDTTPAMMRPSNDPNRKEGLIISCVQVRERKKFIRAFEVLRDENQMVVDLEECISGENTGGKSVDLPLLEAFVSGFQGAYQTKYN